MQPLKLVYAMALADSDQTLASRASVYLQSIDAALKEVDEEKRFNPMFLAEFSAFSTRLHVHLGKIPPPPAEETISSRELQEAEAAVKSNKAAAAAVKIAASNSVKSASDSTNMIKPQSLVEGGKVDPIKSLNTQNSASSSSGGGGGILSSLTGIIFRRTDVSSTAAAVGPKVVKHAHLAKTNAPQPFFDDKLKRWVFPGEETAAAPGQVAPPTSSTSNAVNAGSSSLSSAPTTTSSSAQSIGKDGKSESSGAAQVNSSSLTESLESTNGGGGTAGGAGAVVAGRRSGRSRYVDTLGSSSSSSLPTSSTASAPPAIPPATTVNPFVNRPSGSSAKYSVFAPPPPPAPTQQELEEAEAERKRRLLEDELEALRKSQAAASAHVQNAPQTGGAPQANINAEGVNQLPPPLKSSDDTLPFAKVKPDPAPPEIDF
jgi:hypothetical protein